MNNTFTVAIAAASGVTMMLSACGSTTSSRDATAHAAPSTTVAASVSPTTRAVSPSLLPEPTGGLAVGVRTIPSVSPAATTRVWYPAVTGTGTGTARYFSGPTLAAYGVPAKQLKGVMPRASVDAEPAPTTNARAAVVLMPGWGSTMALSSALAQDLASNGYVV